MFFSLPLLALLAIVVGGWTFFFSTGGLHPTPPAQRSFPFYRRFLMMLPGLALALHIESSEQHHAAILVIQWRK